MNAAAIDAVGSRTALVVGPTGSVGSAVAQALAARGWRVRGLHRDPATASRNPAVPANIEWYAGDAMRCSDVVAASRGADLIFHAANPPRYRRWRELAIPMLANSVSAAEQSGARVIFPGNLYNFSPDAGMLVDEHAPQRPPTRKGAIRVEMERLLERATERGVRSLVVRAGDYFGPHAHSSWFGAAMVKPGRRVSRLLYPGLPEIGHTWAYLPDLAAAIAHLADIERELAIFDVYHFGGHWLERGVAMTDAICRIVGEPSITVHRVPWPLLQVASPFSRFLRELIEMRYLWRVPLRLDNRKLLGVIGSEPHTPLDEAVAASLTSLGCLPT